VRQGSAVVATPSHISRLSPGQIIVVGYGVHHAELPGTFTAPHRAFWCHLFPEQVTLADTGFDPNHEVISSVLLVPTPPQTERIAQDICAELSVRSWGYPRVIQGLLTQLSVLLARRIRRGQTVSKRVREGPPPAGGERTWMAVEAALQFCAASFRADVSRDDVARAVGYSPGHLGRLVSAHLGYSLSEYLNNLRVDEAKRLLTDSDIPVRQIAPLVGYADPAHFTRAFKRATGVSPTAFRREAQARRAPTVGHLSMPSDV
jgi:AraC-like DNA-binding protein